METLHEWRESCGVFLIIYDLLTTNLRPDYLIHPTLLVWLLLCEIINDELAKLASG